MEFELQRFAMNYQSGLMIGQDKQKIDEMSDGYDDIKRSAERAESNATQVVTQIEALQNTVDAMQATISNLEEKVKENDTLQDKISVLESKIEEMELKQGDINSEEIRECINDITTDGENVYFHRVNGQLAYTLEPAQS